MKKISLLTLFGWIMLPYCLLGQSGIYPKSNRFVLNVCYNRFKQNDSSSFLEISTAFYLNQMNLQKDTAGYHGGIDESIVIRKKQDAIVVDAGRFTIPINVPDSASVSDAKPVVTKYCYTLGFGTYMVSVSGSDDLNHSHRDSSVFEVQIDQVPKLVAVSDVELSSSITESTDLKDMFYKNSYRVIPNPGMLFGRDNAPVIYSYAELYNLVPDSLYKITACLIDNRDAVLKKQTYLRRYNAQNVVAVNSLNVTSIPSGKYRFALVIADTSGREIARSGKSVFVYNPHLPAREAAALSTDAAEYAGLSNDELADEFRKAQYVASADDITRFEKLTTVESRRKFLMNFWAKVEGMQAGQGNLTRAKYLERVKTANKRYAILGKQGWQTDRGRVYILYGQPDEVQRNPSSQDSKPFETWNYYSIENGVIFVFIDMRGFGNYELVHSTKRGELQDEGWEQYLR